MLPVAHADERLCEDKKMAVRQQLEYAQQYDNQYRVQGLRRALQSIEENCTNERVLEAAEKEVRESQAAVRERELALEQALREGDEDDRQKRREKLAEERRELEEHTQELDLLKQRLNE